MNLQHFSGSGDVLPWEQTRSRWQTARLSDICVKWSMLNRSRLSKHIYFSPSSDCILWVHSLCLCFSHRAFPEYAAVKFSSVIFSYVLKEEAALLHNSNVEVPRPTTARLHFLFRQCVALPKSWVNKALILLGCVFELDYVCLHVF